MNGMYPPYQNNLFVAPRDTKACEVLKVTMHIHSCRNYLVVNSINYVPAWSSDLKRTQSMDGGCFLPMHTYML
ncbi:unnamed protein product [Schistosoma bovis]|nr:unnamed protein product [Schistosoma bovis]